jgi:hypothetical protein
VAGRKVRWSFAPARRFSKQNTNLWQRADQPSTSCTARRVHRTTREQPKIIVPQQNCGCQINFHFF